MDGVSGCNLSRFPELEAEMNLSHLPYPANFTNNTVWDARYRTYFGSILCMQMIPKEIEFSQTFPLAYLQY